MFNRKLLLLLGQERGLDPNFFAAESLLDDSLMKDRFDRLLGSLCTMSLSAKDWDLLCKWLGIAGEVLHKGSK